MFSCDEFKKPESISELWRIPHARIVGLPLGLAGCAPRFAAVVGDTFEFRIAADATTRITLARAPEPEPFTRPKGASDDEMRDGVLTISRPGVWVVRTEIIDVARQLPHWQRDVLVLGFPVAALEALGLDDPLARRRRLRSIACDSRINFETGRVALEPPIGGTGVCRQLIGGDVLNVRDFGCDP